VFGLEEKTPRFYAGGTSGNVSAGLAYFGWSSVAIGRLADDAAGEIVRHDLERWGVDTSFLGLNPVASTPIVLEKISLSKNGVPKHRFLWNCPDCSSYFPPYKALLRTQIDHLERAVDIPQVFFTDRVSRATVALAKYFRTKGAIVLFEPSAAGEPKLFREMLNICDVLKYSAQRARSLSELLREHRAWLEIETLGEDGLRFRTQKSFQSWQMVPSFEVRIKDTAGSGDWTTVGLISTLFTSGRRSLKQYNKRDIVEALTHAQALAAMNCQFEAPRGAMYQLSQSRFLEVLGGVEANRPEALQDPEPISLVGHSTASAVCPACGPQKSHSAYPTAEESTQLR
jgi:fructokinase